MKLDNPKLTAFALGELTPAEQAEIEQLLNSDREIAVEIEETLEVAKILRGNLGAEPCGELAAHQRDAIFREERIVAEIRRGGGRSNETFSPVVVRNSVWHRPGPWQAIAACAVAGLAAYALFVNVGGPQKMNQLGDNGDITVRIAPESLTNTGEIKGAELTVPGEAQTKPNIASAGTDPIKAISSIPKINGVQPHVQIEPTVPGLPPVAGDDPDLPLPESEPSRSKPRGARVVSNKGQQEPDFRAGADIGKKVTDEEVEAYLADRLQEAAKVREGVSYQEFSRVYRPASNGRFEMIRAPKLKVDAEFVGADGKALTTPPPADAKVKRVSDPYLQ